MAKIIVDRQDALEIDKAGIQVSHCRSVSGSSALNDELILASGMDTNLSGYY